jgi:hypothetical protein
MRISMPGFSVHGRAAMASVIMSLAPEAAFACACGCGVFDVASSPMMASDAQGTVFFEYDFANQNKNWSGEHSAPSENNPDKRIRTSFYNIGGQYMFTPQWGVTVEVPYWTRYFKTAEDSGDLAQFNHGDFGDVRIRATYAGLSDDLSTGITFGVKLPTGDYSYPGFDRDTAIGTGSTDLLLGAYRLGNLTDDYAWAWFANAQGDFPIVTQDGYRPGAEINTTVGVSYENWDFETFKIAPLLQFIASYRWQDSGPQHNPDGSGYRRLLISPGVRVNVANVRFDADVALPVYQHVNGNQLISPALFKLAVGYSF